MKRVYSKIESIAGNVITVTAQGIKYGEFVIVKAKDTSSLAEVIKLDREKFLFRFMVVQEVFPRQTR